jgi:hypothetical protein
MAMTELDNQISALFKKLDVMKGEGKHLVKGGEYDSVLSELQVLTRKNIANLVIKPLT